MNSMFFQSWTILFKFHLFSVCFTVFRCCVINVSTLYTFQSDFYGHFFSLNIKNYVQGKILSLYAYQIYLFDNFGNNTCTHSSTTLTDCKTSTFFKSDRCNKSYFNFYVITRHNHLCTFW